MTHLNMLRLRTLAMGLVAGILAAPAHAEDIDIFASPASGADRPNVLLVLDNSANWSSNIPVPNCFYRQNGVLTTEGPKATSPNQEQGKKVAIEKCALHNVIDALPVNTQANNPDNDARFNIGIMLLNESPHGGGYPRQAFLPATTNNKTRLKNLIKGLAIDGDKGSNADFARALYETYLYYAAAAPYNGALMTLSTAGGKVDAAAFGPNSRYLSPSASSCARNHVILIANGSPQSAESDVEARIAVLGGNTTKIVYTNPAMPVSNSDQNNWSDEMARFMASADVSGNGGNQNITVHGIAVTGSSSDGNYPNFIAGIAAAGGGQFRSANSADSLVAALNDILNEIQAVNTVFAAASLPVSVNARGTYLNQVYMGMFRPDASASPRWRGNLKQYRFALDVTGNIQLTDAQGRSAISSSTGFITPSAVSYWTADSDFWVNEQLGTPPSPTDSPDGEVVEKGGAAQQIRLAHATSQAGRRIFTCPGCTGETALGGTSATLFASGNTLITAGALGFSGTTAATDRARLIDWVRGTDNAGDESGPGGTTTIRPSVHGDVLHSRPAIINYGGSTGVVAFYGANDGMLHAINGNQSGAGAGQSLWSFLPDEVYGKLNRLRTGSPELVLPTVPGSASARDYFVDGPIGVYQKIGSNGATEKVHIYVGMRRGGRVLYALDVTDPASPVFLWRKTSANLPRLGQTWSEPKVARIKRPDSTQPVLIFGGGYDAAAEDAATPGATTMGHRVFVLDAFTGDLLKEFDGMARSVAADITLVDSDFDGYIDRAYAADLGGGIWRMDFEAVDGSIGPNNWSIFQLADLSGGTTATRKFMHAPDVVVTRGFTALLIGSGDREKPLLAATQDHFFTVYDRYSAKGRPETPTLTQFADLAAVDGETGSNAGCYVSLLPGEKVVNAATSIGGVTYFGTNQPSAASTTSCSANLGVARSYAMPLFCKEPTASVLAGGGLPPSPVAGIVTIQDGNGASKRVPFVIGAPNAKRSAIEGVRVNPTIRTPRKRVYWYSETSR